jgi:hypothetical protein
MIEIKNHPWIVATPASLPEFSTAPAPSALSELSTASAPTE